MINKFISLFLTVLSVVYLESCTENEAEEPVSSGDLLSFCSLSGDTTYEGNVVGTMRIQRISSDSDSLAFIINNLSNGNAPVRVCDTSSYTVPGVFDVEDSIVVRFSGNIQVNQDSYGYRPIELLSIVPRSLDNESLIQQQESCKRLKQDAESGDSSLTQDFQLVAINPTCPYENSRRDVCNLSLVPVQVSFFDSESGDGFLVLTATTDSLQLILSSCDLPDSYREAGRELLVSGTLKEIFEFEDLAAIPFDITELYVK